mmetsp:Transcript_100036/g.188279  ORF Transcript_100036/g.188279 Transcript_100036/m.188279 type:complete len:456 (-) Transcript_100036:26-1393(-)
MLSTIQRRLLSSTTRAVRMQAAMKDVVNATHGPSVAKVAQVDPKAGIGNQAVAVADGSATWAGAGVLAMAVAGISLAGLGGRQLLKKEESREEKKDEALDEKQAAVEKLQDAEQTLRRAVAAGDAEEAARVRPLVEQARCNLRKVEGGNAEDDQETLEELVARSPYLCGKPAPVPVFKDGVADWKVAQKFSNKDDDPYKQWEKPALPEFLKTDPDRSRITMNVLPVDAYRHEKELYMGEKDKTFAWVFDGVLSEQQCIDLINMFNEKKYVPALTSNNWMYLAGDPRKFDEMEYDPARRDTYISIFDCEGLTDYLWKALEPELKNAPLPKGWRLDHINGRVRGLLYCKKAQCHPPHFDAMMKYPKGKFTEDHEWFNSQSLFTIFVYLTDVPEGSGGTTAFVMPPDGVLKDGDLRVRPKAGRVLIFSQNLRHTGEALKDHVKYVIRSDIMAIPTKDE